MTGRLAKAQAFLRSKFTTAGRAIAADPTKTPVQAVRDLGDLFQRELVAQSGGNLGDIVSLETRAEANVPPPASVAFKFGVTTSLLHRLSLEQDKAKGRGRVADEAGPTTEAAAPENEGKISRPVIQGRHWERHQECAFILGRGFDDIAFGAEAAGWSGHEVATVLVGLSRAYAAAARADELRENEIKSALDVRRPPAA